jgi:hypothetical protein
MATHASYSASLPTISSSSGPDKNEEVPARDSSRRRWYSLTGSDVVFVTLLCAVFLTARQGLLDDPGLGWHLRDIDAMLAQGGWLTADPFTEPVNGYPRPWISNQWLGEIPFWLGERWAGLEGIAAVAAIILAYTMRCLYRMVLTDGAPWPVAAFWVSQAAMGVSCSWVARPNLFTLLFLMVTARLCVLFHEGRRSWRTTLWLIPLFILWANMHGGFLAGFIVLGTTCLIEMTIALLASKSEVATAARRRAVQLLFVSAAVILGTLVNPYGLSLYRWIFLLLGEPYFMELHQEWRSPDFHGKGAIRFEWLMLLFPLLLALSRRRPNLVELGLALVWFHLALTGFRYVPLWVVVVIPLLARSSRELPGVHQLSGLFSGEAGSFAKRRGSSWTWSLLVGLALLGLARAAEGRFARHQPAILPAQSLNRFLQIHAEWRQTHGHRPVVFHSYDWGGYLTWHGSPEVRNWIDDRNEVQGKERIQEYFAILETDPGWSEKLDRYHVELICIQPRAALTFRLAESKKWRERYRDEWAVIYQRQRSP